MPPPREDHIIPAQPAQQAGESADAAQTADLSLATWRDITAALAPIIGSLGVIALFKRTLHLASAEYPWLKASGNGASPADPYAGLHAALCAQPPAAAAAAQQTLARTFQKLLTSLIGASLTERLLAPASDHPDSTSTSAAQDPPP